MSVLSALATLIAQLLREDDRRCLLGEDVRSGGMLGLSKAAASDENLRVRLLGSPLTNAAHVAHVGGLALAGLWPIVLLPSSALLLEGLPALRELARLPWRSGGQRSLPILFVAPDGPGFGLGGDAAESVDAMLSRVPGLELWSAGRTDELAAFLRSAADFSAEAPGNPCAPRVLLIPRRLLVSDYDGELDLDNPLSRSPTAVIRSGQHATVLAWGDALEPALAAADAFAQEKQPLDIGVVDVGRLAPLDDATIDLLVDAARSSGKLVIAHSGPRTHGLGAELAALFCDRAILQLDAPILRVCGEAALVAGYEEARVTPTATAIAEAILEVVYY